MQRALFSSIVSTILLFVTCDTFAGPDHDVIGKKPGDIIAPMTDEKIAAWCDFNKQIVVTKTNVLCVYNGASNS